MHRRLRAQYAGRGLHPQPLARHEHPLDAAHDEGDGLTQKTVAAMSSTWAPWPEIKTRPKYFLWVGDNYDMIILRVAG
jgi:hypothetical protein